MHLVQHSIVWTPPLLLQSGGKGGGGSEFQLPPSEGKSEILKNEVEVWVQGQVLLKGMMTLFLFDFSKVYHFHIFIIFLQMHWQNFANSKII